MQVMTQEQNEQWQRAFPTQDYLGSYALSKKGLEAATERLQRSGVPDWAVRLRNNLISEGQAVREPWVPQFALRSEASMLGLQLLYSDGLERFGGDWVSIHVRLRFLHEVLRPFVEYAEQLDNEQRALLRSCYQPLIQVYRITDFVDIPPEGHIFKEVLERAKELWLRLDDNSEDLESAEGKDALQLSWKLTEEWDPRRRDIDTVRLSLYRQHHWRLGKDPHDQSARLEYHHPKQRYQHFLATAFLTALEAECPPPDWLPRI